MRGLVSGRFGDGSGGVPDGSLMGDKVCMDHGSLLTRLVFRFGRTEKLTNFPFKKLFLEFSEQTYPTENYFLMKLE